MRLGETRRNSLAGLGCSGRSRRRSQFLIGSFCGGLGGLQRILGHWLQYGL